MRAILRRFNRSPDTWSPRKTFARTALLTARLTAPTLPSFNLSPEWDCRPRPCKRTPKLPRQIHRLNLCHSRRETNPHSQLHRDHTIISVDFFSAQSEGKT